MRANFNPTRMKFINLVGQKLLNKIFTFCPRCQTPGFGIVKSVPGLPCSDCGYETKGIKFNIYQCSLCYFEEERKRSDNVLYSDPGECDICNP